MTAGSIRSGKRRGETTPEILAFKERGQRPCGYVLATQDAQLSSIGKRIGELVALRPDLLDLRARAGDLAPDGACYCTLIEHARPSRG